MNALAWYVLRSKPHKENQVHSQLCANAIETYYPTVKIKPVNPRSAKIRSYFPGYLFVHVDLQDVGVSALQWLPGALGLVQFGGHAPAVPEPFIAELKRRVTAIQEAGSFNLSGLQKGDHVRITSGPLAGYEAIFDVRLSDGDRVRVFLEMLGRLVKTEVDASVIEKKRVV
jgi:transcription antitermination factor NusG